MKTKWQLIFSFVKSNKLLVTIAFISGFFYNILTLLIPVSLGRFYEFNFDFSSRRLQLLEAIPFVRTENFINFLIFFLILISIRFVFEYINKYVIAVIGEGFAKDLREALFKHQLQINTAIYDEKGIGKYLLRYSGDLKSIQNYVTKGLLRFSQDFFLITILLITIAYIDSVLGFIVTISIGVSIFLLFFINNLLYTISVDRRNQRSAMLTFVNTRLRSILSIKVFNKYTPEEKRYIKRSDKLFAVGKKYQRVISLIQSFIPMITYLMLALLMWYVYYLKTSRDNIFDGTVLLILILLIISFLPILRRTLRVSIIWKLGNISFEKLLNIFSLEAENDIPFENIDLADRELELKNISFYYPISNNLIFDNVNMTIHPKKTTLILGESGTGKNTFINLLLKIYNPTNGDIYFGDYNYDDIAEKTIRKNIAVISNAYPLYGRTVYEAIVYNRKKEKETKVTKLLKDLQQFEDDNNVLSLHDPIGDLGSLLTNGQKKILMYCRALLTNKPCLVINQPFRGLNHKTIDHLRGILNSMKGSKTMIVLDVEVIDGLKTDEVYVIENKSLKNA